MKTFASFGRALLTLVVVLVATVVGWQLWSYYMIEPWTRDGRVRPTWSRSPPTCPA
jgi:multidrug resistance efflux pump